MPPANTSCLGLSGVMYLHIFCSFFWCPLPFTCFCTLKPMDGISQMWHDMNESFEIEKAGEFTPRSYNSSRRLAGVTHDVLCVSPNVASICAAGVACAVASVGSAAGAMDIVSAGCHRGSLSGKQMCQEPVWSLTQNGKTVEKHTRRPRATQATAATDKQWPTAWADSQPQTRTRLAGIRNPLAINGHTTFLSHVTLPAHPPLFRPTHRPHASQRHLSCVRSRGAKGTTHLRALATAEIQPTQPSPSVQFPKHRPAQGDASGRGRDFASSPSPRQHVSTQQRRCLRRERELEKASSGTPQPWAQSHTCTSTSELNHTHHLQIP